MWLIGPCSKPSTSHFSPLPTALLPEQTHPNPGVFMVGAGPRSQGGFWCLPFQAGIYVPLEANPAWRRFWGSSTFVVFASIVCYQPGTCCHALSVWFCIFALLLWWTIKDSKASQRKSPATLDEEVWSIKDQPEWPLPPLPPVIINRNDMLAHHPVRPHGPQTQQNVLGDTQLL